MDPNLERLHVGPDGQLVWWAHLSGRKPPSPTPFLPVPQIRISTLAAGGQAPPPTTAVPRDLAVVDHDERWPPPPPPSSSSTPFISSVVLREITLHRCLGRCRSSWCRGCWGCSARGRRWAPTIRLPRAQVGADKFGNRYFTRVEEVDGVMKEKRWVEFKGSDQDPTTVPVEWICWLNGQRKKAPTPEELAELEARRERVKQNIELLKKKEEEEKKTGVRPVKTVGKFESPNLKSFIQQFPDTSLDQRKGHDEVSRSKDGTDTEDATIDTDRSSEPTGTGATFKPGTWQPPT
uniref:NADH dehydrogenase [ubiquinone] 1 alpha subcomplex subunit 12 n=1 Tax=Oryza rufipogon TaxID=4529 RepID=A0A0E0QTB5_ORYRU